VFSPRTGANYDGQRAWLENARAEHRRTPFRAIIADSNADDCILDASEVDEQDERWRVDTGCLVARQAEALVEKVRLLIMASKRVVVIDPFRPDQRDKRRPLAALFDVVADRADVEVHLSDKAIGYEHCMSQAAAKLPALVSPGAHLIIRCWRERDGGERLHNRCMLTDIGGVKFGDGLENGGAGQQDHLG